MAQRERMSGKSVMGIMSRTPVVCLV